MCEPFDGLFLDRVILSPCGRVRLLPRELHFFFLVMRLARLGDREREKERKREREGLSLSVLH